MGAAVTTPGVKLKLPLVHQLHRFDKRFLEWGGEANQVPTRDKRFAWEDRAKVYERMVSERKRIATRYRSEGDGDASRIRGEMQRELQRIRSEAYRTAQEIEGRSDAEATSIYAAVYDQSPESRSLNPFLKALETLKASSHGQTLLLRTTEGDAMRYLKGDGR